jgi:HAD superfamily hydrolase (TIGR01549 family)
VARLKAVIFDFDGTIADTFGAVKQLLAEELPKAGAKSLTTKDLEDYYNGKAKEVLGRLGLGPISLFWLIRKMQRLLNKRLGQVEVFEGIKDVIDNLKKYGIEVGVVSSDIKENVEAVLGRESIEVKRVICGGRLFGKDRLIKNYLKLEHLNPEDVIYIGDEVRDIEACRRAGIKIVAVTWGYNSKKALIKANADWVVNKVEELRKIDK